MKLKNVLITFITMFMLFFVGTVNAETTAPDSFTVSGTDLYKIDASKYLPGGTWDFYFKKNTDGHIIYCTESNDLAVSKGTQKYSLVKELDAKYAYVISNGYPNKSITGNDEKDYFITALSIYYIVNSKDYVFRDFNLADGTYRGEKSDVVQEMAKLINRASNYSYANPSIKVNASNNFTLSSDKKYYVSSGMKVSTTGNVGNYTVSLKNAPSGTVITEINGNVKNTFGAGESFVVKVPVASIKNLSNEFEVSVNAIGSLYKAYLYEPENSKYQNTAAIYPVNNNVNATADIKLSLTTKVEISKVDAITGELLSGATLVIKDSNDTVVKTWVSSDKIEVIKNLPIGKYTLTENSAPEGYKLSTETIDFEVKLDGTVVELVMKNELKDKVPVYISKKDSTTLEELAGAHLELRNEEGNLIRAWVSENTPHMIEEGLKAGKYFLTEVLAPEGYELSNETVEFVVLEDGSVDGDIIMYNKPETIVEVPSTSSFKTITSSLIGIIVIGLGSMIIFRNYKKNEEY